MVYRPDIDGLRAIAVLSVLLFHLGFIGFTGGYVGVDVFFVISGYLITGLLRDEFLANGHISFRNFYLRRVRRLAPAMLFTFAGCVVAAAILFSPGHFQRFAGAQLSAVFSLSNFYFWQESGYFDLDSTLKPLLHTWSLSVEEQFYFVFPLTLLLLLKFARKLTPWILVLIGVGSLVLNLHILGVDHGVLARLFPRASATVTEDSAMAFFLAPFRAYEFAIGAVLVWLDRHQPSRQWVLEPVLLIGLLMIARAILKFDSQTSFPSYNALLPCIGTALVIYAGRAKYSGLLLRNPVAVGIGLISYSLYLVHWPLIVFVSYYTLEPLTLFSRLGILAMAFALAVFMYRYIEQPFRRGKDSWLPARWKPAAGVAMLVTLVSISAHAWFTDGWVWRLPADRQSAYLSPDDAGLKRHGVDREDGTRICSGLNCHSNRTADKELLVLGDSFAGHILSGLDYYFPDYNLHKMDNRCRFHAMSYCQNNRHRNTVAYSRKQVMLDKIARSDAPVLISQNWDVNNDGYYDEVNKRELRFASLDERVAFEVDQLLKLHDRIGKHRSLIVIGEPPSFGREEFPPEACIYTPIRKTACTTNPLSATHAADWPADQWNRKMHDALAGEGILFLDPYLAFCVDGLCTTFDSAIPLYHDAQHFTIAGSRKLVGYFHDQIAAALAANGSPVLPVSTNTP